MHKKERDGRVKDRIKAVLLRDDGWTCAAIAQALFLTEDGVRKQLKDYEISGKLKPENGGSQGLLNAVQTVELLAHLDARLYTKVAEIVAYIRRHYGICYSVRGLTNWLQRNNFTFHQPCGVPAKADAQAQKAFVAEYEKIKTNLKDSDQILFIDGVHPSHAVRFVRGWIRRGQRREIPTNASHKRLNIIGALNLETMTLHRQEYATLNAENVRAFLTGLLDAQPQGTMHVILDRGRYQNCKAIWEFAAENPRLRLHYLPPYSPNINAIEPAWKIMHEHTTNNQYYPTFKEFTEKIHHFFDVTFPKNARNWTERLTDNFRIVGAT
ncbi:MAG: IS630 family transposase [Cytophagales bacterium]